MRIKHYSFLLYPSRDHLAFLKRRGCVVGEITDKTYFELELPEGTQLERGDSPGCYLMIFPDGKRVPAFKPEFSECWGTIWGTNNE